MKRPIVNQLPCSRLDDAKKRRLPYQDLCFTPICHSVPVLHLDLVSPDHVSCTCSICPPSPWPPGHMRWSVFAPRMISRPRTSLSTFLHAGLAASELMKTPFGFSFYDHV